MGVGVEDLPRAEGLAIRIWRQGFGVWILGFRMYPAQSVSHPSPANAGRTCVRACGLQGCLAHKKKKNVGPYSSM